MAAKKNSQKKVKGVEIEAPEQGLLQRVKKAWSEIRTIGFFVFLIISLPSIGLLKFIESLSPKEMGMKEAEFLFDIATNTAPVTVGMILIFIGLIKNWFAGAAFILFAGAVLLVSTLLLNSQGIELIKEAYTNSTGNKLISVPLYIAARYFFVYGWFKFCSALLIGAFGGYAFDRLYLSIQEPAE